MTVINGVKLKKIFGGVYRVNSNLATENSTMGFRVYDEKLIANRKGKKIEYRTWDPFRSKLAAAILNGLKSLPIHQDSNVLYLGASSGTTASHVADITHGSVYCVEFSKRMMRELVPVTLKKKNMIPILGDARRPVEYCHNLASVDVIYQDVAQPNQAEILIRNTEAFSPKFVMLAIKARSINVVKRPKEVFRDEIGKLREKFDVLQTIKLKPYDKDHVVVNLRVK